MTHVLTHLDPPAYDALAAAWRDRTVLVLGDVMLDRYWWGDVTRISPEAPVPVVEIERETLRLGGAANVAQNLRALGGRPRLVGVVGADEAGVQLRSRLVESELDPGGLVVDPERPTSLKTRIVARSQHVVRGDVERRDELAGGLQETVRERVRHGLAEAAAVVLSDYGKGVMTASLLETVREEAAARGVPVCVDPKDTHFFSYRGAAVVTPNQHEAAEVLGYRLRDEETVSRAGRDLLSRLEADAVLITRGSRGMSLFERTGGRTDLPALARRVFDVTGAGDTVVSVCALALAGGAAPREAALVANHAAGLVVAEVGTAVPDPDRLRASVIGGDAWGG